MNHHRLQLHVIKSINIKRLERSSNSTSWQGSLEWQIHSKYTLDPPGSEEHPQEFQDQIHKQHQLRAFCQQVSCISQQPSYMVPKHSMQSISTCLNATKYVLLSSISQINDVYSFLSTTINADKSYSYSFIHFLFMTQIRHNSIKLFAPYCPTPFQTNSILFHLDIILFILLSPESYLGSFYNNKETLNK